ncbi:MAG TPA: saccharopine dehydrogenase NADP-binding domain-containing protein [Gemmatimonadaceae bacterium]|nr:saccharopine dehydrogenase NADP-binding domain-containing protein [Gemmatimonadaceae bacterium]
MTSRRALIYGSNGYTGRLIVERAVERGLRPVLAGRNAEEVEQQANDLGLEHRTFALDDPRVVDAGLAEIDVVLHCAGPFARTSRQMADACLRARAHYLDITGEIAVFEALALRDAEAKASGVMLLPGVGFDVVPSDCLAAHLARRLPTATRLSLGFQALGGLSRGTATTMIESGGGGGMIRRGGALVAVPAAWKSRRIDFGKGPRLATTIPWGDVSTAFHSTGIGDVEVYVAVPAATRRMMIASRYLGWLLGSAPARGWLLRAVRRRPPGPDAAARARGVSRLWGEAEDAAGRLVTSRLTGPEGYTLTALTAVAVLEKVLDGGARAGFQTPSRAFGADFVLEIDGVVREDLDPVARSDPRLRL